MNINWGLMSHWSWLPLVFLGASVSRRQWARLFHPCWFIQLLNKLMVPNLYGARLPKAKLVNGVFARVAVDKGSSVSDSTAYEREKESVKCKLFTQPLIPGQGAAGQGDTPLQQQCQKVTNTLEMNEGWSRSCDDLVRQVKETHIFMGFSRTIRDAFKVDEGFLLFITWSFLLFILAKQKKEKKRYVKNWILRLFTCSWILRKIKHRAEVIKSSLNPNIYNKHKSITL